MTQCAAAHMRYLHDRDHEIVHVLANREWRTQGSGSVDAMLAAFDACAERVGPALSGHWTAR